MKSGIVASRWPDNPCPHCGRIIVDLIMEPEMKLTIQELDFLSAWAREEKTANPYVLPAHQLQVGHKMPSVVLIRAIKAWAKSEGRSDEDIFGVRVNSTPGWPWASEGELIERIQQLSSPVLA